MTTQDTFKGQLLQEDALNYMTGGNATVTFKSIKSGVHYTYRFLCSEDSKNLVIDILNGPDNTKNYKTAFYFSTDKGLRFYSSKFFKETSQAVQMFKWVFNHLLLKPETPIGNLEIWHEGKCCRCGRKLTVPESIENGIGPECIKKQNSFII